jgi:hypothetical protein
MRFHDQLIVFILIQKTFPGQASASDGFDDVDLNSTEKA